MSRPRGWWRAVFGLLLLLGACGTSQERVIVAAGTTLVDSGLIDRVAARYEAGHPGVEISVIGEATARVLDLGRRGAADVLITHAPRLEEEFVEEGRAAWRAPVFSSEFLLVGPEGRVGRYAGLTVAEAMAALAGGGDGFVSRGDQSGTHVVEMGLWEETALDPTGAPWYVVTGQGMGLTLQVADQRDLFTLTEAGAYQAARQTVDLAVVATSDRPANPYSVIVVEGASAAADGFATWLISEEGRSAIVAADAALFEEPVYRP